MPPDNALKGYAFALLATVAGSTVYLFSKAAFSQVSLAQFGIYWFGFAILWNGLYALTPPVRKNTQLNFSRKALSMLALIGLIEIIATGTFYAAIKASANPAIPSFLRNMEYIFVTIMGVWLLKERFTAPEAAGVVLTFSGAMVISYTRGASPAAYLTGTSGLMLISTVFYGFRTILAKSNIQILPPVLLSLNRALFLLAGAIVMLLALGESPAIPQKALVNIAIGSFLGPFLTSLGQYSALKYIEASRSAIVQSTTALFVLIGAYLVFGRFPLGYQVIGGILTIAGPMLLVMGRMKTKAHTG